MAPAPPLQACKSSFNHCQVPTFWHTADEPSNPLCLHQKPSPLFPLQSPRLLHVVPSRPTRRLTSKSIPTRLQWRVYIHRKTLFFSNCLCNLMQSPTGYELKIQNCIILIPHILQLLFHIQTLTMYLLGEPVPRQVIINRHNAFT